MRNRPARRATHVAVLACLAALALLTAACGEDAPATIPGAALAIEDPFSGGYPTYEDPTTGVRVVFGTPDLGVGESRVSFALFDGERIPVSAPSITGVVRHYPDGPGEAPEAVGSGEFQYRPFPDGRRGIYTGSLALDRPGLWSLEVAVPGVDGATAVLVPVEVAEDTVAPGIGDPAPASASRTRADEPDLSRLTTATTPDPVLYEIGIAEALAAGQAFVVTFASPAFCTSALCGPQVEVLSELAVVHGRSLAFIHVDLYENPHEIRGDLSVARRTPILEEWGVHTDEWTFVVDERGKVTARFEGFAPRAELEEAILPLLPSAAR